MAFSDLIDLRKNMELNEIAVFSTKYSYNNVDCYIAYCLLTQEDKLLEKYHYAILRMRFIHCNDLENYIDCPANSRGIDVKYGKLRRFFNIKYDPNGTGEWYNKLIADIGKSISPYIPQQTDELNKTSINTVCQHENRDPNRIYRSHLLRHHVDDNGNGKCRTEYNSQLAAFRFPSLYKHYRNDKHVSFAFTDDINKEVTEQEAYDKFIDLEQKRKL